MIVLGIDGALGAFSVALARDSHHAQADCVPSNLALERGLQAIASVLQRSATGPDAIDRVAVGVGPGSFTGTRIAISYAKSLAQAWRVGLVAVSSFAALEEGIGFNPAVPLLTVVRGRPGIVSVRYRARDGDRRASGSAQQVLARLGAALEVPSLQVAGVAEDVLAELGERAVKVQLLGPPPQPPALAIARAAMRRAPLASLHELRADYGELPPARRP